MVCAGTLGGISVALYGVRRHLGRHIYRYLRCAGAPWEAYMLQFMVCAGALGGISVAIYGVCGRLGGISIVFYGVRGAFPATFVAICGFCAPEGMPPLDRGTAPVPNWGEKIMCASCADHVRKHFWPLVDFALLDASRREPTAALMVPPWGSDLMRRCHVYALLGAPSGSQQLRLWHLAGGVI